MLYITNTSQRSWTQLTLKSIFQEIQTFAIIPIFGAVFLLWGRFAVLISSPDEYSGVGFLVLQKLAQFVVAWFGILWCVLDTVTKVRHIFNIIPDVIIGGICAITVSAGIYLLWLGLAGNMELELLGGSFVLIASPAYSVYKRLITGRWMNMGGGYGGMKLQIWRRTVKFLRVGRVFWFCISCWVAGL